jgi:hypothetical protein
MNTELMIGVGLLFISLVMFGYVIYRDIKLMREMMKRR